MSKDLTMDLVRVGQLALMEQPVQEKLEACAARYLSTKELNVRSRAKAEFYNEYYSVYTDAIDHVVEAKKPEQVIAALEIGEGLAEMAFIKSVRQIAKVDAMDFSVSRTNRDILLEERAPHLASSRSDRTPTPTPSIPTTPTSTSSSFGR